MSWLRVNRVIGLGLDLIGAGLAHNLVARGRDHGAGIDHRLPDS